MAVLQPDQAFFRDAILDTIVPEASRPGLPEVLEDSLEAVTEDEPSLIPVKQRDHLYFGMRNLSLWRTIVSYSFTDVQMKD